MSIVPRPTGKELVRVLHKSGFQLIRIRGSHHFFRHADGRSTVVPVHAGEVIGPGLLYKILRDCELTVPQLTEML